MPEVGLAVALEAVVVSEPMAMLAAAPVAGKVVAKRAAG